MLLSHRIQLDPTVKQTHYFAQAVGTARFVWNWGLAEWNAQYEEGGRPKVTELKRYFNSVKYERWPWLRSIHRDAHAQPFTNLQRAFTAFFKHGKSKRPKFKKKGRCRDSFYVANDKLTIDGQVVRLPVVGKVRMTEALRFVGKLQSAVVSRQADRWFISFSIDVPHKAVSPSSGARIGVDLGLTTFATFSDGRKINAPKPLISSLRRLRRLSRYHSRKQLRSNNRHKSAMRLACHYQRVRSVRQDFLHKLSTALAKNHSEICIEDLAVLNMGRNRRLSRAVYDAGWAEFRRQLEYKCLLHGSTLIVRDRFYASSKSCSKCGHRLAQLPLSVRKWTCPDCGAAHDRDVNAAINLLNLSVPMADRESTPGEIAALTPHRV